MVILCDGAISQHCRNVKFGLPARGSGHAVVAAHGETRTTTCGLGRAAASTGCRSARSCQALRMYHQRDDGRAVRALAALCCCAAAAAAAAPAGHSAAVSSTKKPCDIYAAAGSPCVAAHSLVRALYGGYIGALYRVKRASDNRTAAIAVTAAGGYADASAQDAFCKGSDCVVDVIFDQSPNKNDLLVGIGGDVETGPGGRASPDLGVNASRLPITLAGRHKAYGAYVEIGMGYRTNNTDDKPCPGLATGNEPETVYMVASGTHFNGGCCFDVRSPLSSLIISSSVIRSLL